ncbi:hypothetical protein RUM44_003448 [Polyplax serrata]|uniref:PDZ domain-containing protein n=1 Tax=Polyplax serrata TaxID=468196 RepID=A0ABR1AGI1_POLSC
MDNMPPGLAEKSQIGAGISNGSSFRRSSLRPMSTSTSLDGSIPIGPASSFHTVVVVVHKDENGYGMNVSGDNPVYVQSVKEGGAAEKAGLQCGDMIIKVNGVNVTQSTHIQVVSLIRASADVELTVRQNCRNQLPRGSIVSMSSSPHLRPIHSHSSTGRTDRITGPQPVDVDKLRQLESQRVHTFRLMLEKEQLYVDALRSELAKCIDSQSESKIQQELNGATRRVSTLQEQLKNLLVSSEHSIGTLNPRVIYQK